MKKLTLDKYHQQQADCEDLCTITHEMVDENPKLMECVTCPFCKEIVNAILTKTTIACPACSVIVDR